MYHWTLVLWKAASAVFRLLSIPMRTGKLAFNTFRNSGILFSHLSYYCSISSDILSLLWHRKTEVDFIGNKTINFSLRVSLLFTNAGYKVRRVSSAHKSFHVKLLGTITYQWLVQLYTYTVHAQGRKSLNTEGGQPCLYFVSCLSFRLESQLLMRLTPPCYSLLFAFALTALACLRLKD